MVVTESDRGDGEGSVLIAGGVEDKAGVKGVQLDMRTRDRAMLWVVHDALHGAEDGGPRECRGQKQYRENEKHATCEMQVSLQDEGVHRIFLGHGRVTIRWH